jgi:hypothetical protein
VAAAAAVVFFVIDARNAPPERADAGATAGLRPSLGPDQAGLGYGWVF